MPSKWRSPKCDYSLDNVTHGPFKFGDELMTTLLVSSISCGFAAVGGPNVPARSSCSKTTSHTTAPSAFWTRAICIAVWAGGV
jgi:hypothetical protein